jgi:hypothetical protein
MHWHLPSVRAIPISQAFDTLDPILKSSQLIGVTACAVYAYALVRERGGGMW